MAEERTFIKIQKFSASPEKTTNTGGSAWKSQLSKLMAKNCLAQLRERQPSIIVSALSDTSFRVCSTNIDEPMELLSLFGKTYASKNTANKISILASIYAKRYNRRYLWRVLLMNLCKKTS